MDQQFLKLTGSSNSGRRRIAASIILAGDGVIGGEGGGEAAAEGGEPVFSFCSCLMRVLVKLKIYGSVTVFHIDCTIVVSKLTFIPLYFGRRSGG